MLGGSSGGGSKMRRIRRRAVRSEDQQRRAIPRQSTAQRSRQATRDSLTLAGNRTISRIVQQDPEGLPRDLRARLEGLSGFSLADVRVHRGSSEPERMDAFAFTQGSAIHLGAGQEEYLAHEAWHVVQQKQGRVPVTGEASGRPLNHSLALESEADDMGARAHSAKPAARGAALASVAAPAHSPVQLKCRLCGAKSHNENKCPKAEKPEKEESSGGRGLLPAGPKERELFEAILPRLDVESMYGSGGKSLVGGNKGKPNGLAPKLKSVRIDRQGLGNVQFQIGDDSYACAEFEQDTEPEAIIAALRASLLSGKNEQA